MRRVSRVNWSIDLFCDRRSSVAQPPYLCSACRSRTAYLSTSRLQQAEGSYTERIRQKIWGTSKPPGLQDPYDGSSNTKHQAARKASKALKVSSAQVPRPTPTPYKRATTLEELEVLELPEAEPLYLNSFVPAEVITDGDEITTCLHRALVETFACSQAGRPLSDIWRMEPGVDQTHTIQIKPADSGVEISFTNRFTCEQLLDSLSLPRNLDGGVTLADENKLLEEVAEAPQADAENSARVSGIEEITVDDGPEMFNGILSDSVAGTTTVNETSPTYHDVVKSWDPSWLQISLYDPEVKFAVMKRMMQLTGIRIKDPEIRSIKSAKSLLKILIKPSKPVKLVDTLVEDEKLMTLPNISVFAKKVTKIDKDIQVGRWKIIEKELRKRDLPLTHRG